MKVFYTGVNLYGQFSDEITEIINEFTELDIHEDILFYAISLTYSVFITKTQIIVRGFFNGRPYQNIKIIDFNIQSIKQISCNEIHILILSKNGDIWQLKALDNDKFHLITNFIRCESEEKFADDIITKIYCGKNMNLCVSKFGNSFNIPIRLNCDNTVKDVACGQEHGILLCDDGQVYTWGIGSRGQLGHDDLESQIDPCVVKALCGIQIKKIAAGGWHCAALSVDGDVYVWGWNSNGQLGFFNDNIEQSVYNTSTTCNEHNSTESISVLYTPRPLTVDDSLDSHIVDIACGMRHTLVLRDDGCLYGAGFNKYNQLGLMYSKENLCHMTKIMKFNKPCDKISINCGPYCSTYSLHD